MLRRISTILGLDRNLVDDLRISLRCDVNRMRSEHSRLCRNVCMTMHTRFRINMLEQRALIAYYLRENAALAAEDLPQIFRFFAELARIGI